MGRWGWILGIALAAGCAPSHKPIRGEWVMAGNPDPITFHFNDDGTYVASFTGGEFKVKQFGEFNQNATWLHMYVKRIEASDSRLQAEFDKTRLEAQHMQAKWKNEDLILLDSGKGSREIRRVKK